MNSIVIRRGFVDIDEGQMHYRHCGSTNNPPLVVLHGSPLSSHSVIPIMTALAKYFRVIAPDMLGNGDSSPPTKLPVTIEYLADAMLRAVEALGLKEFYLYGYHTGGNLGIEAALARPRVVRKLIIEGMGLYNDEERAGLLANQAPEILTDLEGTQLLRAWHLVRDGKIFWPWWNRTRDGARKSGLPDAKQLHRDVLELLKGIDTYHHAYRAALAYVKQPRAAILRLPVLVSAAESDVLKEHLIEAAKLIPEARHAVIGDPSTESGLRKTAEIYRNFLLP